MTQHSFMHSRAKRKHPVRSCKRVKQLPIGSTSVDPAHVLRPARHESCAGPKPRIAPHVPRAPRAPQSGAAESASHVSAWTNVDRLGRITDSHAVERFRLRMGRSKTRRREIEGIVQRLTLSALPEAGAALAHEGRVARPAVLRPVVLLARAL